MRGRSHTTPRRRGPKLPLPAPCRGSYEEVSESPYYTIDNTEDIYGTTLLPSQRCYVDPWDLENYDYVRKKLDSTGVRTSPEPYYETSMPICPYYSAPPKMHEKIPNAQQKRMAKTMPRNRRRSHWNQSCQLRCCTSSEPMLRPHMYEDTRSELLGVGRGKYEDYMSRVIMNLEAEEDAYNGNGSVSSSSSTELDSSIGEGYYQAQSITSKKTSGYDAVTLPSYGRPSPQLQFPAPPSLPPPTFSHDYSNPYATLPHCSVSDCYDCSMIYGSPQPVYDLYSNGECSNKGSTIYSSTRPSSSLYSGIYAHKFGLSKKGLLQIDYSCSWNDLDRIMSRHF
ncbi:uncharacterized protein LOC126754580 isoform X1 [Bactrocera neohumeralis]|uniref:uncharacterized protein LOC126754580 isoform X1 n=1 Tax=Bactrocera neohumeralis TaxID=98809 RepID=UPI0021656CA4|nr:uncharacterized protein LOC126754580 isoform X1 [Bactrocera neohumeralis]XP_050322637.1 uncharacterized protein LOC126754580 isoform X1 [Bactrocera neohumeralis]XP_050322639.1 uncharacterized protein LOC126754580 isoform X1 [Bactrocera neohumeralis]XP_050322640.1 uncharacterized protein LOC126754580 isoform X1 [Bactrocera neohumeralis]